MKSVQVYEGDGVKPVVVKDHTTRKYWYFIVWDNLSPNPQSYLQELAGKYKQRLWTNEIANALRFPTKQAAIAAAVKDWPGQAVPDDVIYKRLPS